MTWGHFEQDNHQRKKNHKIKTTKNVKNLSLFLTKGIVAYSEKIKEEGRTLPC